MITSSAPRAVRGDTSSDLHRLLGMLLGATLLSGIGQWIVLFPVGLILFEVKIRMEEHLMVATFPDEYPRYRRQVPQLIPGLYALRQRHSASSYRDRPALGAHDWKRMRHRHQGPPGGRPARCRTETSGPGRARRLCVATVGER
jgi:Putative protein-S-isoprenylcysteine methyltransferase